MAEERKATSSPALIRQTSRTPFRANVSMGDFSRILIASGWPTGKKCSSLRTAPRDVPQCRVRFLSSLVRFFKLALAKVFTKHLAAQRGTKRVIRSRADADHQLLTDNGRDCWAGGCAGFDDGCGRGMGTGVQDGRSADHRAGGGDSGGEVRLASGPGRA